MSTASADVEGSHEVSRAVGPRGKGQVITGNPSNRPTDLGSAAMQDVFIDELGHS